jgi:hypothetical protein
MKNVEQLYKKRITRGNHVTEDDKKYRIFPSITRALSIQKRSVNGKKDGARCTMNARYAIKIEKIPDLHTYVHNNLKQCILRK